LISFFFSFGYRDLKILFFLPGVPRNLRNDLLVAADSITNTMSSLVKELHSGTPVNLLPKPTS